MSKIRQNSKYKGIITSILMDWYNPESRNLPWKKTNDPYLIWLSEIILQQTRVAQGTPYYLKFEAEFPTIQKLADAPIDKVLKLWEGLGYYSRARNLHQAAKFVTQELSGRFPDNYNDLLKLKGVGEYTAAAIASFAYHEPVAVVDGNVYRVLSRIFGIKTPIDIPEGKKEFRVIAERELDKKNPAVYNQAIMDFGATMCLPKLPKCDICPFQNDCVAFDQQIIDQLPIKAKKIKKRNRYFNYIILTDDANILIKKRNEKDIWQGLYEFPMKETEVKIKEAFIQELYPIDQNLVNEMPAKYFTSPTYKQTLTHQNIQAQFTIYKFNSIKNMETAPNLTLINKESISKYPFPKIINDFLKDFDL